MLITNDHKKDGRRSGIALITVLGFLSIILLMAVTLMTMTRVEKLVSISAEQAAKTRQLAKSALATAMDEVDDWFWPETGNLQIHPAQEDEVMYSDASGIAEIDGGEFTEEELDSLFSPDLLEWLPEKYYDADPAVRWVLILDPKEDINGNRPILGRYAYLAFDCTGMLDINVIAQENMNRGEGKSLKEVELQSPPLTDIPSGTVPSAGGATASGNALRFNRSHYKRFDTMGEINRLNDGFSRAHTGAWFSAEWNDPNAEADVFRSPNKNFTPYSLTYDTTNKAWWDWDDMKWRNPGEFSDSVSVPPNIADWDENDAEDVFDELDYDNASDMAQCLMDYMDTDFYPGITGSGTPNTQIPCCEPIPMINEVVATSDFRIVGADVFMTITLGVEVWYPFAGVTNDHTYSLKVDSLTLSGAPTYRDYNGPATYTLIPEANPIAVEPATFKVGDAHFVDDFCSITNVYRYKHTPPAATLVQPVKLRARNDTTSIKISLSDGGKVVDEVDVDYALKFDDRIDNATIAVGKPPKSAGIIDPRLNHAQKWDDYGVTINKINWDWDGKGMGVSENGDLEGTNLYVRNGPPQSQAELGFIPTGEPWTTIDLFSPQGRTLLKVLRDADQPMTNQIFGTVNPNSSYQEVLQLLFMDAPIEEYPGQPDPPTVERSMAGLIATGIVDYTRQPRDRKASLDSGAAWVTTEAFIATNGTLTTKEDLNNNQKEGIIRNSYRLFNANNNLFTYVVIAQSIQDDDNIGVWDGEDIDIPSGESRIAALVWRDPFPESAPDDRHTQFIRRLKYMDDVN